MALFSKALLSAHRPFCRGLVMMRSRMLDYPATIMILRLANYTAVKASRLGSQPSL